jgi:hypothetical protein
MAEQDDEETTDLIEVMRRRRVNAMIADALFLRSLEPSDEKTEAVERVIRRAMYEHALGGITSDERTEVFRALEDAESPASEP